MFILFFKHRRIQQDHHRWMHLWGHVSWSCDYSFDCFVWIANCIWDMESVALVRTPVENVVAYFCAASSRDRIADMENVASLVLVACAADASAPWPAFWLSLCWFGVVVGALVRLSMALDGLVNWLALDAVQVLALVLPLTGFRPLQCCRRSHWRYRRHIKWCYHHSVPSHCEFEMVAAKHSYRFAHWTALDRIRHAENSRTHSHLIWTNLKNEK